MLLTGGGFTLKCRVDIRQWTHITVSASGSNVDQLRPVKLYINGHMCSSKNVGSNLKTEPPKSLSQSWDKLKIVDVHVGVTMLDEWKLFDTTPATDEVVMEMYEKEKERIMG